MQHAQTIQRINKCGRSYPMQRKEGFNLITVSMNRKDDGSLSIA